MGKSVSKQGTNLSFLISEIKPLDIFIFKKEEKKNEIIEYYGIVVNSDIFPVPDKKLYLILANGPGENYEVILKELSKFIKSYDSINFTKIIYYHLKTNLDEKKKETEFNNNPEKYIKTKNIFREKLAQTYSNHLLENQCYPMCCLSRVASDFPNINPTLQFIKEIYELFGITKNFHGFLESDKFALTLVKHG